MSSYIKQNHLDMNLISQEEHQAQSDALIQTATTQSTEGSTPTAAETLETSAPEATSESNSDMVAPESLTTTAKSAPQMDTPNLTEAELQYQGLLNKRDADIAKMSCAQITDDVVLLLQSGELPPRSIIDRYKSAFYSKMNSYLSSVSEENAKLRAEAEAQEIRLKELLNDFKERNRKRQEKLAEEQKANLEIKHGLVNRLRDLLSSSESFDVISKEYREIVDTWRQTGAVPPGDMRQVHSEFEHLREQFYDLQQINNEFREYDFKKNLEAKQTIIQRAKELAESSDVTQAARELQDLHHRWRDVGPVAKELRKELWKQFQELSARINASNQEYHNQQRTQESENEAIKRDIIAQLEAINPNEITTIQDWRKYTDQIKELQEQWRHVGHVPRAVSEELYLHFRTACDIFFDKRKEFMRERNKVIGEQGERKRAIIAEIEQLISDERWFEGHPRMQELQTEWNELIPTNKHLALFKRFRTACDTFYTHYKALHKERRQESKESVAAAKQLIARAKELASTGELSNELRDAAIDLQQEFRQIGYMPRKVQQDLYKEFKEHMDSFFSRLRSSDKPKGYRRNSGGNRSYTPQSPYGASYDKLLREKEQLVSELQTYSSNKERLSIASSAGEKFLKMIEQRCEDMQRQIDQIDEQLRSIRKEQKAQQENTQSPSDSAEQQKSE